MSCKREIAVVELFAGVGGFHLGLSRASSLFSVVFANQWEPGKKPANQYAFHCYEHHFGDKTVCSNVDINIAKKDVPDHDLLVGGFPCQDYSVAQGTNARGIKGKKGVLWWIIKDIISSKQPKFVLLENVDRLIRSPHEQRGRDFAIILRSFFDEGYNLEWRIINAADYGCFQRRRRIFIFATKASNPFFKEDLVELRETVLNTGFFASIFPIFDFKSSTITNHDISLAKNSLEEISAHFSGNFENAGIMKNGNVLTVKVLPRPQEAKKLSEILESGSVDKKYFINEKKAAKFSKLKDNKRIPKFTPDLEIYWYSEGRMSFPDPMDMPSRTILTSEGTISRSTHVIVDKQTGTNRLLTPLECERLNGFDDNWTDTGMSETYRYFCMGNALVVPLVERMGREIARIWEEALDDK